MRKSVVIVFVLFGLVLGGFDWPVLTDRRIGEVVMAAEGVGARQAHIAGRDVGEVVVHNRVVLRLRTPAGGLTPFQRAVIVARRLVAFLEEGSPPETIFADSIGGMTVVSWNRRPLVTVDAVHARLNNTTRYLLARVWANNLRRALGEKPLPQEFAMAANDKEIMTVFCVASWYGKPFDGQHTASGEIFKQEELTAAHRYLPFGTRVRVTNLHNGKSVEVIINDRGPYVEGRAIDLSRAAAVAIGLEERGIGSVKLEVFGTGRVI